MEKNHNYYQKKYQDEFFLTEKNPKFEVSVPPDKKSKRRRSQLDSKKKESYPYVLLYKLLKSSNRDERSSGAISINKCKNGKKVDLYSIALTDEDALVRGNALISISGLKRKNKEIMELVKNCIDDEDENNRFISNILCENWIKRNKKKH